MTRIKGRLHPPPGRINLTARPLVLRLFPDTGLRETARSLSRSNAQVEVLARDMLALMQARRGIGLAAPQIGLSVRLIVARGLLARVLPHEVDHLDGILIVDRAPADPAKPSSRDRDPAAETRYSSGKLSDEQPE